MALVIEYIDAVYIVKNVEFSVILKHTKSTEMI